MTSTSVGMRCPECVSERTQVRVGAGAFSATDVPYATYALIAINVIAFIAEIGAGGNFTNGTLIHDGGLAGVPVANGDWYRIVTAGFLHAGPLHLLFNMYVLYICGTLLEPGIGTPRFLAIYFVSLLGGSFGALLLSPHDLTVGASGAIFGLMAAVLVVARGRGIDQIASQFGLFIVLNLALSVAIPGISIGGHLGGLIAGGLAALVLVGAERSSAPRNTLIAVEAGWIVLLVILTVAGSMVAANAA